MSQQPNIEAALKHLKQALTESTDQFGERATAAEEIRAAIAELTPKRYQLSIGGTTVCDTSNGLYGRTFRCSSVETANWLAHVLNAHEDAKLQP